MCMIGTQPAKHTRVQYPQKKKRSPPARRLAPRFPNFAFFEFPPSHPSATDGREQARRHTGVCDGDEYQRKWNDAGEALPVTSSSPPEMRQAASPKHAVSIKAATSRNIQENWLTPWPPPTKLNFV